MDKPLILLGAVVLAGVLVWFSISKLSGVNKSVKPITTKAITTALLNPNELIKIAMSPSTKMKETAKKISEYYSLKPHKRASHQLLYPLTLKEIELFNENLQKNTLDVGFIQASFSKCQVWLTLTNPGATEFPDNDPNIINRYYGSLSGGGASVLKIYSISKTLYENIETINQLCSEVDCPELKNCANCWPTLEEYVKQIQQGNDDIEAELALRTKRCGESCAAYCANIFPSLKLIYGTQLLNPEVRNTFISTGVRIV